MRELLSKIEAWEFRWRVAGVERASIMLDLAFAERPVNDLRDVLSSDPESQTVLFTHTASILQAGASDKYVHESDLASAVYMVLLHEVGAQDLTLVLATLSSSIPNAIWSHKVADELFAQSTYATGAVISARDVYVLGASENPSLSYASYTDVVHIAGDSARRHPIVLNSIAWLASDSSLSLETLSENVVSTFNMACA